jgi:branched-subunit amino acid transport protein
MDNVDNLAGLWLVLVVAGVVTFGFRLSFIALSEHIHMPVLAQRALRFVPVAVLTAIIVPALVLSQGTLDVSLDNTRLLAGVLATLVAWRTRNMLLTIAVGMAGLWLLQMLLPA